MEAEAQRPWVDLAARDEESYARFYVSHAVDDGKTKRFSCTSESGDHILCLLGGFYHN